MVHGTLNHPIHSSGSLYFNGSISEATLHAYLSRAVSCSNELTSPYMADDLRMFQSLGALFLGRAIYPFEWVDWRGEYDGDEQGMMSRARSFIERAHANNPDVIVQGICAEATFPSVNRIPVPAWVFEEFGEPIEQRNFRFDEMYRPDHPASYEWTGQGLNCIVLDLTRPETQRWMYYRCRTLIDAGCEAIHMGQPHLYAEKDRGAQILESLLERVRAYARKQARRHLVLLDAHTHGIARHGRLLFDLHSRPISAVSWREKPFRIILQLKGKSMGGIAPSGWSCASLPYLVEIDNWGGYSIDLADWDNMDKRAAQRRWGWDDIAWFSNQTQAERDHFLLYAHRWLRMQDPAAHFQMPARRTLGSVEILHSSGVTITDYHANRPSAACPIGFDQEDTIARIWAEPDPVWLADWHLRFHDQPTSLSMDGQDVPQPAVLVGSLQRILGGEPGDSWGPYSGMVYHGDGLFKLAALIPWAGNYQFCVALGGTMTETIHQGGIHSGNLFAIRAGTDNLRIRIQLNYATKEVSVIDDAGNSLLMEK